MSKPEPLTAAERIALSVLKAQRLQMHKRTLAEIESARHPDTYVLDAREARVHADIEATEKADLPRLRELAAKLGVKTFLRETREELTGTKGRRADAPLIYRIFDHIWKTWVRKGKPDDGVEMPLEAIARKFDRKERWIREIIHNDLAKFVHVVNGGRRPNRYRPKYL